MSQLSTLEAALWQGNASVLAASHSHRAVLEDSTGIIKGRDAIVAVWVARVPSEVGITADLGDVIGIAAADDAWKLHRWVWREDGRVVREVEITDRVRDLATPKLHPPLGELRAGLGQFAASAEPLLPASFAPECVDLACQLHKSWNARTLGPSPDPIQLQLLRDLPDGVILFEAGCASGDARAVLFRLMGHNKSGRRIRLFGSAITAHGNVEMLIDTSAYAVQSAAEHIDYGMTWDAGSARPVNKLSI